MNKEDQFFQRTGGQTQRLPGASHDAALHEQLYRYAEDLEELVLRHSELEDRNALLVSALEQMTESRAMLAGMIDRSEDMHITTDPAGMILQCNAASESIAPANRMSGGELVRWVMPASDAAYRAILKCAIQPGGERCDYRELQLMRDGNDLSPIIVSAKAMLTKLHGKPMLHWIMRDITHLRETEFETKISSMIFKNAEEAVMITDIQGDILAVNPAFTRITGYEAKEAIGRNPRFLKSGVQDSQFYLGLWRALKENGSWQGEIYNRRKNGQIYPEWLTISSARDNDGRILSHIAVFSDMSRQLQDKKRLAYLAHHDALTGLPNRLLFQDRLDQLIALGNRTDTPFTVVFIDLDHFKPINDTFGHAIGDAVLMETTRRFVSVFRAIDTVARLAGDEFVILAPALSGEDNINIVCNKVLAAIAQPIEVDGHSLDVSCSIGCAEFPRHGSDSVTLVRCADQAMYQAKAAGGNRYVIYDHSVTGVSGGQVG